MFEAIELGRSVEKATFEVEVEQLRADLIEAQRALRGSEVPVIVIVSGVEGAGKSAVVNRFHGWLDTRGLRTATFFEEGEEERERPPYWRFWRSLPPRGTIGMLFGSWYTQPIVERAFERIDEAEFEHRLRRISEFETMLARDGALIVKLWFHLPRDIQTKRLRKQLQEEKEREGKGKKGKGKKGKGKKEKEKKAKKGGKKEKRAEEDDLSATLRDYADNYERFASVSERAIRLSDIGLAPWHLIESTDKRYRDLTAGKILLEALRSRLAEGKVSHTTAPHTPAQTSELSGKTVLDTVPLDYVLDRTDYEVRLKKLRKQIRALSWRAHEEHRSTVVVFEGWDAGGKGGAIRRLTGSMDARLYQVIPVAAPTDEERAQHYLWRFWRYLPPAGAVHIYDRSWYGRVLVERVEGFARPDEWQRAYKEINDFEEQLTEHGIVVVKFWLHISKEEQLRRFEERERVAYKKHKITEEDWRNRERWDDYLAAVNDMVARTSTGCAPWTLVAGNDKLAARIQVLETFAQRLEAGLKR
ncbi:MAG TPA: polyphosphate:AMP phosphotransferase [Planctomycetes bacterium]|nr:polyphosphate:AMP phosphotransferase [Planctomycetota bacterium]